MTKDQMLSAMVTGGGTGIGRAIALRLARCGCSIAIVYSSSKIEAEETAGDVAALGARCITIRADISQISDVDRAVSSTVSEFGGLDWLVNNAAITYQLPFSSLDAIHAEMWARLFSVNVCGAFELSRKAARHLAKAGHGSILNVGSIAGVTGYGSSIPYAVSKAAMHGLTRSLAIALAPRIRVNAIAPGAVGTRWWAGNEDKMKMLAGRVALERVSTPDDIADSAFMVLSAQSMTGQIIVLDNGQTL